MRAITIVSAMLLTLAASVGIAGQQKSPTFVDGEVLVKFRSDAADDSIAKANAKLGAVTLERLGDLGWQRLKVPQGLSVDQAIAKFKGVAEVEDAQPNFYYHLLATPNDPLFSSTGMWGMRMISMPLAWDFSTGSSTVVVADIDTGLRYTHQDLAANAWTNMGELPNNGVDDDGNGYIDDYYGYDFRYNDPDPWDEHGHGTHTAGTIGAVGNNLLGVVGVNWNVKIMPIKIYSASGTDSTSAMLVNAYNYVRIMKRRGVNIRVTNNSYGDCPEACGYDRATRDALDAMGNAGILNVFAAGNANINNDVTPSYPVSYNMPTIIGVASSTSTDGKSSFSSYGPTTVDIAAPGSGVLSTYNTSDTSTATLSGTSMATPHVAGAAALLSAFDPSLSPASLKATLMNTVDPVPVWNGLIKSGGRLNVAAALQTPTVCSFGLSSNSMRVPTKGGYFSISVTALQNCDYSARSNASWIYISAPDVYSGNGTVNFRVTINQRISRSGTITIGDQTFTVTQSRG